MKPKFHLSVRKVQSLALSLNGSQFAHSHKLCSFRSTLMRQVWVSYSGAYEGNCLLGCSVVYCGVNRLMTRRNWRFCCNCPKYRGSSFLGSAVQVKFYQTTSRSILKDSDAHLFYYCYYYHHRHHHQHHHLLIYRFDSELIPFFNFFRIKDWNIVYM
jgi:hypothetical protein